MSMNKELRSLRLLTFIIAIIEIAILALFLVAYFYNFFNLRDIPNLLIYVFTILAVIIIFNLLVLVVAIIKFNKIRRLNDLTAADLIGADIQEAYNFGMIGLVVTNESGLVLWTSELFKDRQIDIIDNNILEWQPALRDATGESIVRVEVNSRNYEVKFIAEAGLYIFKDITEFYSLDKYSKDHALVIGIIMIDNYSDISGVADDFNDVVSKVRNAIFEYAKEYHVLLRRYRNDAYFAICDYQALESMQEDKFSLLEKVHKIGEKEETPPTLSIGFAHEFPDANKLNEMATSAIDIAMSRGGDQVVVSKYGEELVFYGGKTEAVEARNKVKVRVLADSIFSLIKNAKNVIVMGHTETDMDAIGACLGIAAISKHFEKDCWVVYEPKLTERKTRGAMTSAFTRDELNKLTVTPSEALEKLKANTLLVVVDVHRPSMTLAPKLLEKASKVLVIDHHRRAEEFIENPIFSYIEPSASSSCELIAELVRYSGANPRVVIPSSYATIMLSGIFLDTNFFKSKSCGIRTFEASMILKEYGADNSTADDYLKDEFEEYSLITHIISTMKTPYYGIVYCKADEDDLIEQATIAKVANQCLQMKGVNACFVIGNIGEKKTKISCRSDGTINVQLLAEKMKGDGGGGHFTSSAVIFTNYSIDRAETRLLDVLSEYLNDARKVTN